MYYIFYNNIDLIFVNVLLTSLCMHFFLVQTLIDLRETQRSRVRVPASARNFFEHFRKRTSPFFQFFFETCFLPSKGPPFKLFDILQQAEISKRPKGLPFEVFRHYETVSKFSACVNIPTVSTRVDKTAVTENGCVNF